MNEKRPCPICDGTGELHAYEAQGYVYMTAPNHPNVPASGVIAEHRLVAERSLGRLLSADEVVHHVDHDRANNHPDNLVVLTRSEHAKEHSSEPRWVELTCAECGTEFTRAWNQRPEVKGYAHAYCSRKCSGTATRRGQMARAA